MSATIRGEKRVLISESEPQHADEPWRPLSGDQSWDSLICLGLFFCFFGHWKSRDALAQLVRTVEVSLKAGSLCGCDSAQNIVLFLSLLIIILILLPRSLSSEGFRIFEKADMILGMPTFAFVWGYSYKEAEFVKGSKKKASGILFYSCQKCLATINYHNHTECQFRSFSTLTKAPDLDPMKQKKADVMGLRKSPRGVKPHPQTPQQPPLPSISVPNPTPCPPSSEAVTFGRSTNMVTLIPKCSRFETFSGKVWAFR